MKNLNEYIRFKFNTNNSTYTASDTITGTITIQALKDFSFDSFSVSLNKRIKGQLSTPDKRSYGNTFLENDQHWKAGKTYEYDIEIQIPEDAFSYSGENLEIIWSIELELDPNDETTSMLRKEFLTSIEFHNLFKSFRNFKHEYYINIKSIEREYKILPEINSLENDNRIHILLGLAILIGSACFFKFSESGFPFGFILAGIGLYILYKNIYHAISVGKLGELKYCSETINENNFKLKLIIPKNHRSIKNLNYYCSIIEKVTDNRGTTTKTHTETIHKSTENNLKQTIKKENELIVPYPNNKNLPITLNILDAQIIWNVSLQLEFKNGTVYTQELPINITKN